MAETLGEGDHVSLLEETLEQEKETDEKLTDLAEQINTQANANERQHAAGSQYKKEVQASSVMSYRKRLRLFGARRFLFRAYSP